MEITASEAPELLIDVLLAKKVPMLTSSPGLGKSAIAKQIAKKLQLKLIDVRLSQCDPTDLLGFPSINKDRTKAGYIPMDTFPVEGDKIPDGYKGWFILFDELTSASMAVQAAAYKIILDRQIGLFNLHKNVAMMGAGNLASDNAVVNRISTALQSRMIHFQLGVDHKSFMDWANANDVDFRVIAFLNFQKDLLQKFDPDHNDHTFACARTWEFTSDIIKKWKVIPMSKLPIIAGTVSEGVAREFMGFCDIFRSLPTEQEIIDYPETFKLPDNEPSIMYAITGLISSILSTHNAVPLMKAINRFLPEFQVICLIGALKRDKSLISEPALASWVSKNAQELV